MPDSILAGLARGSDRGVRGLSGPLVRLPISSLAYSTSGAALSVGNNSYNPDGSTAILPLSATAGPPNGAWVTAPISGRVVGVRWRRDSGATPFFDVIIDGKAYRVEDTNPRIDNVSTGWTDYESTYIVADDLADKRHTVTVAVPCDKVGGATRVLNFIGFVAERGRGYADAPALPRSAYLQLSTLTTTAASITWSTPVAGLKFNNTDTVARVVTIYGPDGTTVYDQKTLAPGEVWTLNFPAPRAMTGWKAKADAASVVKMWTENA